MNEKIAQEKTEITNRYNGCFCRNSAGEKKQPQAFFIGLSAVQNMIHDI